MSNLCYYNETDRKNGSKASTFILSDPELAWSQREDFYPFFDSPSIALGAFGCERPHREGTSDVERVT